MLAAPLPRRPARRGRAWVWPIFLLAFTPPIADAASVPKEPATGGAYYGKPLETIEIVADEAPVTLANTVLATVKKGRWFGVRERKGDLVGIQFFGGRNLRQGWVQARDVREIRDEDVDLAAEALKLAHEFDPAVDVAALAARVAALAARVAQAAATAASAREKAMQISVQLFGREGFGYDAAPRTLDRVLEEKRGNCLSLSLLYLCAAGKLKMPFRMLPFPGHALIRYDDGAEQFNVEPSFGGMVFVNDAHMRQLYGPPEGISWTLLSKPQTMAMLYSDVGSMLGDQKRRAEAETCFTRAIEINPNYGVAYYNWGTLLAAMNQHALACDKFSRATRLHPNYPEALNNWGSSLGKLGDFQGACEKFALSAKLDPRSAMAYFNWGSALLALGKREEALEKFEKAIEQQSSMKPFIDEALRQ